jgi:hypothetical protein
VALVWIFNVALRLQTAPKKDNFNALIKYSNARGIPKHSMASRLVSHCQKYGVPFDKLSFITPRELLLLPFNCVYFNNIINGMGSKSKNQMMERQEENPRGKREERSGERDAYRSVASILRRYVCVCVCV